MICHAVQEALSVRSDNELLVDPVLTDTQIDDHLESCADCQAFEKVSRRFTQLLRVDAVSEVPDLASSVLQALPAKAPRVARRRFGQAAVAIVAVGAAITAGSIRFDDQPATEDFALVPTLADIAATPPLTIAPALSKVVVWSPNSLSDDETDRITSNDGVAKSSVAGLSSIDVISESSEASTMEVLSFDPDTYPQFVSASASSSFSTLGAQETMLSETAALASNLSAGNHITLSTGAELLITAVLPDSAMADADIALVSETASLLSTERDTFILIDTQTGTSDLESVLQWSADPQLVVVNRADDVSPRVAPKFLNDLELSEDETPDLEWLRANIRRGTVPLLGEVRCHRDVIRALTGAMSRLEARGLEALIDPNATIECFDRQSSAEAGDHWLHNTGLAIDINLVPDEPATNIDRRLRNVMEKFGFDWGGDSLIPQPSHFEYIGPYVQGTPPPGEDTTPTGN